MQNKGAIRLLAITFALVSLYQLSFTFKTKSVENDAREFAGGDIQKEQAYLDSIAGESVYNFFGIKKFTYKDCKELELNLGLDLKGGMNVTMEVDVVDLIKSLSNHSKDATFNEAISRARKMQENSQEDFVTLFARAFKEVDPSAKLSSPDIFRNINLKDKIQYGASNEDVIKVIRKETEGAINNTFNILRTRIDRFGVAQPNISKADISGRIIVELPGIKDPERVRKLLQGTAALEFWETYENEEIHPYLLKANERLVEIRNAESNNSIIEEDKTNVEAPKKEDKEENSLMTELQDSLKNDSLSSFEDEAERAKRFPLFSLLNPMTDNRGHLAKGSTIGYARSRDTSKVNEIFANAQIKSILPRNVRLLWSVKAPSWARGNDILELHAIKVNTRNQKAPLDGDAIVTASQGYGDSSAEVEVSMTMNGQGAKTWARMTKDNKGRCIAIVLDDYVYSAPRVTNEIKGGNSSITGDFTVEEGKDLANILKSGKLPAPARIISEEIVGPSLGKESIESGMWSFIIAFSLVLVYMVFFYSKDAGLAANFALITNLFFIFGVLASLGAVLTLPGIAGIVLTIGMSVDANVLIFERIQEELRAGKGLKLAIKDGYRNAYSAIVDGNITTLLTGIILYIFGEGPIKGFATTLIIGIFSSLFCAIFITRLILDKRASKDKGVSFTSKITDGWLRSGNIKFLEKRKIFYVLSIVAISISIISLSVRGLNQGIDFTGGRTYVVQLDKSMQVENVASALGVVYGEEPEVKTFGSGNQVKITTKYKINEKATEVDEEVERLLFQGLKPFLNEGTTMERFIDVNRKQSQKVGPTIADDIRQAAVWSILFALIVIFLYIMARFTKWQYGLGAIVALAHDTLIVLGIFSLLYGVLPFSLEIDQAFIAAILTVVGYSINDTVVVFDRIREYFKLHPKRDEVEVTDSALNSTLRRTFSTSLSTFVVLLAIFIFGGTSIKGFTFALLCGVAVGTYSSLFIATPIAFDTRKKVANVVSKRLKK